MSKELVISSNRHETKVALIDDDQLVEVYFQRSNEYSLAGSIHKGRVTRVLPGMQSAFVDLGLERDTFLYVSDFLEDHEDFDKITGEERSPAQRGGGRDRDGAPRDRDRDRGGRREGGAPRQDRPYRTEQPSGEGPQAAGAGESGVAVSGGAEGAVGQATEGESATGTETHGAASGEGQAAVFQSVSESVSQSVSPNASPSASPSGDSPARESQEREKQENERRGRRSRRRRRGSRGFPDSKYANEGAAGSEKSSTAREGGKSGGAQPERFAAHPAGTEKQTGQASSEAAASGMDRSGDHSVHHAELNAQSHADQSAPAAPMMLPGESLAKYRNAPVQPVTQESLQPIAPTAPPVHLPEVVSPSSLDEPENEYDEPIHYPPENALPDAPIHHPEVGHAEVGHLEAGHTEAPQAEPGLETGALEARVTASPSRQALVTQAPANKEAVGDVSPSFFTPSPFPTEEFFAAAPMTGEPQQEAAQTESKDAGIEENESEVEGESEGEGDDEASPAVPHVLVGHSFDDDEDHDIQAMILGDMEGIEISQPPAAEGAAETGTAESGAAPAQERGSRFPHRVSRRRRRGGRGGGSFQGNGGQGNGGQGNGGEGNRGQGNSEGTRNEQSAAAPGPDSAPVPVSAVPPAGEVRADGPRESRGDTRREGRGERSGSRPNNAQPLISDLLKEGQEIIVQIAKEPLGAKGARITSHIALPGRYVVYMPTLEHMGVSRKIESDEERLRLKRVLQAKRPGPVGGFITRTAAEGRTEDEIAGDMQFLYNLWADIKTKADKGPAPKMLHHDLDIVQRILRDQLADNFKAIWIDNEEHYESVLRFVETFQPALVPKVKLYTREAPIFDAFNVTAELEKALRPKVWLKSGGFIVINQTEALVAIDVNTGKYVGKTNRLEDTIVKTNTEAIKEIVRQIRLRDLGGIIVIDFIDMDERKNRAKVMQVLEEAMRVDRAPYKILQFNDFGLVAITRKRVKQSLERTLCSPCPHCEGAGYVKSVQTVVSEILTEARKMAKTVDGKDVLLRVHPEVAKVLKSQQNKFLEELEEVLKRPVLVKSDPLLHHEKFDLG